MNYKLLKAKKSDYDEISNIYQKEFSRVPFNEPWNKEKALYKIKIYSKYCDIFKIIVDNKIIGFAIFNPNFWCPGEIVFGEEMAIIDDYKSKGIGTKVLNELFEYYKNKGFSRFMGITNKESRSINLYKRLNINACDGNILMEKKLK